MNTIFGVLQIISVSNRPTGCKLLNGKFVVCGRLNVCVCVCVCVKLLQSCPALCDPMDCSLPVSSVYGDAPGKNTGVACHDLLQGIFLTQRLNLCLLHLLNCQAGSSPLVPPGKPRLNNDSQNIQVLISETYKP